MIGNQASYEYLYSCPGLCTTQLLAEYSVNMVDCKYSSFFRFFPWKYGDGTISRRPSLHKFLELNDSTAAVISICTIQSPLQSRKGPSVAQRALRGANHASPSYPPRALSAL